MSDAIALPSFAAFRLLLRPWRVGLFSLALVAAIAVISVEQAADSVRFTVAAVISIAVYLIASAATAAWAQASGADAVIARALSGSPARMIIMAALLGAISPLCSCGAVPIIAALLGMGVPLAPVMAFWLASPIMDPEMFVLTWGVLGPEFAVAKAMAAVSLGLLGGTVTHALAGMIGPEQLRDGGTGGSCSARGKVRGDKPVVWRFWSEASHRSAFTGDFLRTLRMLAQWLTLAFILESLMLAYIPAESIAVHLGGAGLGPILLATLVGVPAYLNGYAALPLVDALMDQGLQPGAAMAFLIAGGVTSVPAALAVWALMRPRVFALYICLSLAGAFLIGVGYQFV